MKGSYAVVHHVRRKLSLQVGKREFRLAKGIYVYSGSALGPGGIEARTLRHLRILRGGVASMPPAKKKPHWHVDYLLPHASSLSIVYAESSSRAECLLVASLKKKGFEVVKGFGSTDCRSKCGGHLLYAGDCGLGNVLEKVKEGFEDLRLLPIVGPTFTVAER